MFLRRRVAALEEVDHDMVGLALLLTRQTERAERRAADFDGIHERARQMFEKEAVLLARMDECERHVDDALAGIARKIGAAIGVDVHVHKEGAAS